MGKDYGAGDMRRKESKSGICSSDRKLVQSYLDNRIKISSGTKMIRELLGQNSSKLTVYICCFLAKKIKCFTRDNGEIAKKISADKENK